jgi:nucleotide-binding universal stress UspA family protein
MVAHVAHPLDTDLTPDVVLETARRRFPQVAMEERVLRSREPEWEIVDLARGVDASLVVCATHSRAGITRVLLGSVAMGVVQRAACPVLVQRPSTADSLAWDHRQASSAVSTS